jgi:hypothetical protein
VLDPGSVLELGRASRAPAARRKSRNDFTNSRRDGDGLQRARSAWTCRPHGPTSSSAAPESDRLTLFDASGDEWPVKFAGEAHGFDPTRFMSVKEVRRSDRHTQMALAASAGTPSLAALPQPRRGGGLPRPTYNGFTKGLSTARSDRGSGTPRRVVPTIRKMLRAVPWPRAGQRYQSPP